MCPEGAAKYRNDLMENWILVLFLLKMALPELCCCTVWLMVFQEIPRLRRLGGTTRVSPV